MNKANWSEIRDYLSNVGFAESKTYGRGMSNGECAVWPDGDTAICLMSDYETRKRETETEMEFVQRAVGHHTKSTSDNLTMCREVLEQLRARGMNLEMKKDPERHSYDYSINGIELFSIWSEYVADSAFSQEVEDYRLSASIYMANGVVGDVVSTENVMQFFATMRLHNATWVHSILVCEADSNVILTTRKPHTLLPLMVLYGAESIVREDVKVVTRTENKDAEIDLLLSSGKSATMTVFKIKLKTAVSKEHAEKLAPRKA